MSQKERMMIYMIGDSTMAVAGLAVEGIRELNLLLTHCVVERC
ncbi:hypothetical protein [Anaerorudis cellulosivorans]|nr:hypothetical protein [Seramator thermalis]MCW1734722.1 hypothetical protein [Seramator thermalis]